MSLPTTIVDVTENQQTVPDFLRSLGPLRQPITLLLRGQVVARLVPPEELSNADKQRIAQEGWKLVEQARARNQGVPEREIAQIVHGAVQRVRSLR
jgi:hypothetical protein